MGQLKNKGNLQKILTTRQALELRFFARNVIGVRQDMYEILDKANAFDSRIQKLEKTCELIEKFLGEKLEPLFNSNPFDGSDDGNE